MVAYHKPVLDEKIMRLCAWCSGCWEKVWLKQQHIFSNPNPIPNPIPLPSVSIPIPIWLDGMIFIVIGPGVDFTNVTELFKGIF